MNPEFTNSFSRLSSYIEKECYKGYDPYDTLNSWIPFMKLGKWPSAIITQIQKRNPINIRSLIGISKEINPKAFGLFLQSYSLLYLQTKDKRFLERADFFYNYLKENYSRGYAGYAWGYNFPWASPVKFLDAYIPSSVVTGFVCRGLWQYYQIRNNQEVADILISASEYILKDLSVFTDLSGKCISYTTIMQDICYNSSLLATEVLAIKYNLLKQTELLTFCKDLVNFVISRQKADGKWAYSENISTGEERFQIDFHQGFILESIYEIQKLLKINVPEWNSAIQKGLDFYYNNQFCKTGSSYFRLPKKFPVDIHYQSQGIIVFSKLNMFTKKYPGFEKKIIEWTIDNMQDKNGFFYYRKFKCFIDKTSYMRWGQAWMFLAFVTYNQEYKSYS